MSKFSRVARDAYKAERARHAAYWDEHLEDSFRAVFSWTQNIINSKYRRNYPTE